MVDLVAKIYVLGHRQIGSEGEFLIDDGDAVTFGGDRIADVDALAVDQDLGSGIGLVGARKNFHQGRLAGTVLAHEGQHLAAPSPELDAVQRLHAWKRLRDVAHFQSRYGYARIVRHRVPSRRSFLRYWLV